MSVQAKRWTRGEYERMTELGMFAPESRVQLIEGEILEMPPQNPPHSGTIAVVHDALQAFFANAGFHVRCQLPVAASDDSEPEPDVAVVRGAARDYVRAHPGAADVVLAVEVADSSVDLDRGRKARLYARAGILEYWVIVLPEHALEVFTGPGAAGYQHHAVLRAGDIVSPAAKPDARIGVASLLP